ncbi:DUF6792 domain-containing protein [Lentibacillus sp.]|uniref:DUF6792 domain-containing protein n=1 Tax=Lentibacillus sp. TaxID=1925746 RepID=UPI002B4B5332|nr:DUF6792 domain-containing protein [Lentibacillus sp.]HLS08452.1 DUF6792 domain-containing protein [Lentibacillus sp.]
MKENIITSNEMRLRLIQLEYTNELSKHKLSNDEFEKELKEFKEEFTLNFKRIYLEENRQPLDTDIDIVTSQELNIGNESGYDGTAIHFQSEENNIDEVYVISQGTQDANDWKYNIKAMLAGQDASQAEATRLFTQGAKKHFGVSDSTTVTGLAHSLAHNNNTTANLLYNNTFDKIYSVNGAQSNFYQIYSNDREFRQAVSNEFSLTSRDEIYNLNPDRLKAFAQNYYKDKSQNIHQIISEDDPLYAVSGVRGFFTLGDVQMVDTNTDYPGLRSIMDDIPDDVVKDLQELAIQYTTASNQGGSDAAIQALTGVNMSIFNDGIGNFGQAYITDEFDEMVRDVNDKLPKLLSQIKTVTTNADAIFQRFVHAGYINSDQKQLIVTELTNIQSELEGIQESISGMAESRDMLSIFPPVINDADALWQGFIHARAIQESLDKLNTEAFRDLLQMIGSGHGITGILESMNKGNKSYLGTDMILTSTKGKGEIRVNISATLRMYDEGKSVLEDKSTEIKRLQTAIDREIMQCYKTERKKVMNQIYDMEASPSTYTYLLRKHVYFARLDKSITGINVHEEFDPFNHTNMDDKISLLNESVEKGHTYLENYRSSIETLFDEEENIAALFDVVEGV